MFWLFVKKVEGGKQLHFSRFDESFHDLTRQTIHSLIDLGDSKLKDGPETLLGHIDIHMGENTLRCHNFGRLESLFKVLF